MYCLFIFSMQGVVRLDLSYGFVKECFLTKQMPFMLNQFYTEYDIEQMSLGSL